MGLIAGPPISRTYMGDSGRYGRSYHPLMEICTELDPDAQRRRLIEQARISRLIDLQVRSFTMEALAISRELLSLPIYQRPALYPAGGKSCRRPTD